jgi:PAS domain S-box-containing protein
MPLRLKTKFTLTTSLLVLAVAVVTSGLYAALLIREAISNAAENADLVVQQIFSQAQHALEDAAEAGSAPESAAPEALREYVRKTLDENHALTSLIDASVGYTAHIYEVTFADSRGIALISSDASLPGQPAPRRAPVEHLLSAGLLQQLRALYGRQQVYEQHLAFNLGPQPFGEIRVALSTALLRDQIAPKLRAAGLAALAFVVALTLLAAWISHRALRPLALIEAQLDSISKGDEAATLPAVHSGELGQVSTKITQLGQQLRGVQDIFGTLRENVNQVMAGLDDGLILFTREGRAVLVSPAVEKFLGVKSQALLGKSVSEIFPPGHPLQTALGISGDRLPAVAIVHVELNGAGREAARVSASVQVIREGPQERMGALLTLRDAGSLERLDSQLQVSERLSAMGRVTAGVAHEVKNPLNSMRLWIENLKSAMPGLAPEPAPGAPERRADSAPQQEMARQAVQILDSEIDRLDRVVKTFLDFSRPVEVGRKETRLAEVLREVAAVAQPQFAKAGLELALELREDVPAARVDPQLIKQAVLNLVLNAAEAIRGQGPRADGRRGWVILGLERVGPHAEIRVEDNGPGIPEEHRGKVFQLFFTTRQGGHGIGLATAFRIAQLHGGGLDFETEAGRGTTFRMQLPLAN